MKFLILGLAIGFIISSDNLNAKQGRTVYVEWQKDVCYADDLPHGGAKPLTPNEWKKIIGWAHDETQSKVLDQAEETLRRYK